MTHGRSFQQGRDDWSGELEHQEEESEISRHRGWGRTQEEPWSREEEGPQSTGASLRLLRRKEGSLLRDGGRQSTRGVNIINLMKLAKDPHVLVTRRRKV